MGKLCSIKVAVGAHAAWHSWLHVCHYARKRQCLAACQDVKRQAALHVAQHSLLSWAFFELEALLGADCNLQDSQWIYSSLQLNQKRRGAKFRKKKYEQMWCKLSACICLYCILLICRLSLKTCWDLRSLKGCGMVVQGSIRRRDAEDTILILYPVYCILITLHIFMYILIEDCGGQLLNCRSNIQTLWWKLMKAKANKENYRGSFLLCHGSKAGSSRETRFIYAGRLIPTLKQVRRSKHATRRETCTVTRVPAFQRI